MPGTSGVSIRSFTAGLAGDPSGFDPIVACAWSRLASAGAADMALGCAGWLDLGYRPRGPPTDTFNDPDATPARSSTEARERSRRLA